MASVFRFVVIVAALILSRGAEAYPAVEATQYRHQFCFSTPAAPTWKASAAEACAEAAAGAYALQQMGQCGYPNNYHYATGSVTGVNAEANPPTCSASWSWAGGQSSGSGTFALEKSTGYSCPSGGTLSGNQCICPEGQTDTGSACTQPQCQAAGTPAGAQNYTLGWALSSVPDANDVVVDHMADFARSRLCMTQCEVAPKGGSGTVEGCWRSSAPSDEGLYRISCDVKSEYTGQACEETPENSMANPLHASPTCPTGNVGSVNGKAVCLGSMPAQGINFGSGQYNGNPRASTKPTDSNQIREPKAQDGGGPDARGGPDLTIRPDGGLGTGNTRTGISGNGQQQGGSPSNVPNVEIELNTCGTPDTPPCKIDESGTPDGASADTEAKEGINTEAGKLDTKLGQVVSGEGAPDRSLGFSISFPTNCSAFTLPVPGMGSFQVDVCQWQPMAHDILALVWVASTIFLCIGMVFRAVTAGA